MSFKILALLAAASDAAQISSKPRFSLRSWLKLQQAPTFGPCANSMSSFFYGLSGCERATTTTKKPDETTTTTEKPLDDDPTEGGGGGDGGTTVTTGPGGDTGVTTGAGDTDVTTVAGGGGGGGGGDVQPTTSTSTTSTTTFPIPLPVQPDSSADVLNDDGQLTDGNGNAKPLAADLSVFCSRYPGYQIGDDLETLNLRSANLATIDEYCSKWNFYGKFKPSTIVGNSQYDLTYGCCGACPLVAFRNNPYNLQAFFRLQGRIDRLPELLPEFMNSTAKAKEWCSISNNFLRFLTGNYFTNAFNTLKSYAIQDEYKDDPAFQCSTIPPYYSSSQSRPWPALGTSYINKIILSCSNL